MKFKITMFDRDPSFFDVVSVLACMIVLALLIIALLVFTPVWVFQYGVIGLLIWGVYHFIKTGIEIETKEDK